MSSVEQQPACWHGVSSSPACLSLTLSSLFGAGQAEGMQEFLGQEKALHNDTMLRYTRVAAECSSLDAQVRDLQRMLREMTTERDAGLKKTEQLHKRLHRSGRLCSV